MKFKFFYGFLLLGFGCSGQTECESDSTIAEEESEIEYTWGSQESDNSTETNGNNSGSNSNSGNQNTEEVAPACPDSWVLTYSLEGRVDITHTPLNIGNADAEVGGLDTDEVVIRMRNNNGVPDNGQVLVTYFALLQDFRVSVNMLGEIAIVSDLQSMGYNECGITSGILDDDAIYWDECQYGSKHGSNNWSPEGSAYGPGCLQDYHVEGTVNCIDDSWLVSCNDGWLDEGINDFDYTYNQPLLDFQFDSNNLERFTMVGSTYGTELPTTTNNRMWLTLEGELKSMVLEPTPDCLCSQ